MTRTAIQNELNALRSAAPTSVPAFMARRVTRIAELESMLASAPAEVIADDNAALLRFEADARAERNMERRGY